MNTYQVHYTSCRKGVSGHSGFQVRSHSKELAPTDLAEIEARSGYRPPLDAPAAPSEEELGGSFPVALRSYRLPGGAVALTRVAYSGRDYSGRWGNFFAHTLVLDPSVAPAELGWPIDYFDWPGWLSRLAAEEDTEVAPPPLPGLDITQIEKAPSFVWAELGNFIREDASRETRLAAMAQALLTGVAGKRPVVIKAAVFDLPYWIGCLQKLLPPCLVWDLTLSTYEDDPRQSAQITGTCGQTYFSFEESELRFRVYGFDLVGGATSDVGPVGRYAATTAGWLARRPEQLERYHQWLQALRKVELAHLEPSLDLFRLLGGEDEALDWATAELLEYTARFTPRAPWLERFLEAFLRLGKLRTLTAEASLFEFLLDRASTLDPVLTTRVLDSWLQRATRGWVAEPGGPEAFDLFWSTLKEGAPALFASAAKRWSGGWAWLTPAAGIPSGERLVPFLLAVGTAAGRRRIWREAALESLFKRAAAMPGGEEKLLTLSGRDGRDLLDLLDFLGRGDSETDRRLGRILGTVLVGWPEAPEVRAVLETAEAWEILFGEWLGRVDACADGASRARALASYEQKELSRLPRFKARALPWIRWAVFSQSSQNEQIAAIRQWFGDGSLREFPPDLLRQCLEAGQKALPLDSGGSALDELARQIVEITKERKLFFAPDRARLRLALGSAPAASLGKRQLDEIVAALEGLPEDETRGFLTLLLVKLLPATDRESHDKVLSALEQVAPGQLPAQVYEQALRQLDSESSLKMARYWVQAKDLTSSRKRIGELAEDTLVGWLAAHPAQLAEAEEKFPRLRDAGPNWERWLERIGKKRRNPLVRVRGWCNGLLAKLPFTNRR